MTDQFAPIEERNNTALAERLFRERVLKEKAE